MDDRDQPTRRQFLATNAAVFAGVTCGLGKTIASPVHTEPGISVEIPTGFTTLDRLTGGFHRGELVVLASPPGMGKTALALNIADHVAVEPGLPTLYVTQQASQIDIAERLVCARGPIDHRAMKNRSLSTEDGQRLKRAAAQLCDSPFYVDDKHPRTTAEIRNLAVRLNRRLKPSAPLGLLVVDEAGLLACSNRNRVGRGGLEEIIPDLKRIAEQLTVAVLCLCRIDPTPASTVNGCSPGVGRRTIENNAQVVLSLHHETNPAGRQNGCQGAVNRTWLGVFRPDDVAPRNVNLAWMANFLRFDEIGEALTSGEPFVPVDSRIDSPPVPAVGRRGSPA